MDAKFKIKYKRIGNYPGAGVLGPHLSRHHIISYPFMQVFAIVAAWYCAAHKPELSPAFTAFFTARGVNGTAFLSLFASKPDKTQTYLEVDPLLPYAGILNWVCWAESNLFIGPAGCFRSDDPSQRVDQLPINMDNRQKALASGVVQAWGKIANPRIVGEDGQLIEFTVKNTEKAAMFNFVKAYLDYINYSQVIYVTRYDDWMAVPIGSKQAHTFWVNTNARQQSADSAPADFQFQLRTRQADTSEPVVCIREFDKKKEKAVGLLRDRSRMGAADEALFRGNNW